MIVCFASINLDLFFALPHLPQPGQTVLCPGVVMTPGGKGANQALAAARDGARVLAVGAVGRDALAAPALALLREGGVDLGRVVACDAPTGCAAVQVDAQGRNQIAVASGANLAARAAQAEDAILGPDTTLLLSMEMDAGETAALIARARTRGARIVLNLAPGGALPAESFAAIDALLVNEDEAAWLAAHMGAAGPDAAALAQATGRAVIRTLGAEGAELAAGGAFWRIGALGVDAIDTVAAGDAFAGVLAATLDRGASLADAMRRASVAAALACTKRGAQSSLPARAEIDAALPRLAPARRLA
ncbi:MAG: ribokinase [Alphaproteobacteria bacterium]|nr:ribokinase [Alphaproteobacteria bacterium]